MNLLSIILSIIIILSIGRVFLALLNIDDKFNISELFGYSWGLGVGLVALQLFIYQLIEIQWNTVSILLPWIIIIILIVYKHGDFTVTIPRITKNKLTILLVLCNLLLVTFVGFESILRPVQAWDGYANWLLRPKIFFEQNTIDKNYFNFTKDDYPLVMPLIGTFGYILVGEVDDTNILLYYFMFYLSLGFIFLGSLNKHFSINFALLFTFLLLSTQNIIRHGGRYEAGYADLALGYFIFACVTLLIKYYDTKKTTILLLLSTMIAITSQVKNDSLPICFMICALLIVNCIKTKLYKNILVLSIPVIMQLGWMLYKYIHNYPSNFLFEYGIHTHFNKAFPIFISMIKEFITIQNWNLLWIVFFTTIIFYKKNTTIKLILVLLFSQWISYYLTFLFSPNEPISHVANVIDRLYLHIAPTATLVTANLLTFFYHKRKHII